jgi:hypothetical protein
MDQPQSGRPASASRPARRSLVEFALPASDALVEMPSAPRPLPTVQPALATQPDKQPFKTSGKRRDKIMHQPLNEDQKVAASGLRQTNNLDDAMLEDDAIFHQFEDMTSAAAKAAKDYRSWTLEHMKINICATLDYANGLASVNSRTDLVAHPDTREQGKSTYSQSADKTTPAVAKVADEYRAKAFELMTANINTTLEYAQRLVTVKTPTEFVELSTSHARKQLELIIKQTADLGSIAQRLATSNVERMTAGFAKTLGERKE